MKPTILVLATISCLSTAALAQQQEASPEIQAMSGKIMREISEGLQCQTANIKIAKENEALKARVKELEGREKPRSEDAEKP